MRLHVTQINPPLENIVLSVPYHAKAVVAQVGQHAFGQIKAKLRPAADILPRIMEEDHALVKVTRTSICQTDRRVLGSQKDHYLGNGPLCLGHEGGGYIVQLGHSLRYQYYEGQKVLFLPHYSCQLCDQCIKGYTNLCPNMKHMGIHFHGTFADYVSHPERCLYPLEHEFNDDAIPLIEPLSCVIRAWDLFTSNYPSIKKKNEKVAIYGAGPMGVLSALWAKKNLPNLKIDLIDSSKIRAQSVFKATKLKVRSRAESKYDHTMAFSSCLEAYNMAVEMTKDNGRIIAFSGINQNDLDQAQKHNKTLPSLYEYVHRKELVVKLPNVSKVMIGTSGYTRKNIKRCIEELNFNYQYYSKVQNAVVQGLDSEVVEINQNKINLKENVLTRLLQTNKSVELDSLQSSVLKLLVRMS